MHSVPARAWAYERRINMGMYGVLCSLFVFLFIFNAQDANDRSHLLFQSCGPFAGVTDDKVKDACRCGRYPLYTEEQDPCLIPSSTGE